MSHNSNFFGNYGSQQPNSGYDDFRKQGLSDTQAREADAAARQAREGRKSNK